MNTGALIKELRKQKRISAETIAEKLNVHPSTVYTDCRIYCPKNAKMPVRYVGKETTTGILKKENK